MKRLRRSNYKCTTLLLIAHPSNAGIGHIHPDGVRHHLFPPLPGNDVERHETERRHHLRGDRQPDAGDLLTRHIRALADEDFAFTQHLGEFGERRVVVRVSLRRWSGGAASHQVGDLRDERSVRRVGRRDGQLQRESVSQRRGVGRRGDVQVVLLARVEGGVRPDGDLVLGLLLWSQVSLHGLSLGDTQQRSRGLGRKKEARIRDNPPLLFSNLFI